MKVGISIDTSLGFSTVTGIVMVIPTNEELMIARDMAEISKKVK